MTVKLLTEHHFEFLSSKGGSRGSSESTPVKMSNCWKSHATAHYIHAITGDEQQKQDEGQTEETAQKTEEQKAEGQTEQKQELQEQKGMLCKDKTFFLLKI